MSFVILSLYELPKDSTRIEDQQPWRNFQHCPSYADKCKEKHHKTTYSVYGIAGGVAYLNLFSKPGNKTCKVYLHVLHYNKLRIVPWVFIAFLSYSAQHY